jgi:molybdopterin-binding protein
VRNSVAARVCRWCRYRAAACRELDIGRTSVLLARITARASQELALTPDKQVWALIKAVSLRGHVFNAPAR